jgi:hypothetical protein
MSLMRWKKNSSLQAEASACVLGLSNVLFVRWVFHIVSFLTAKLLLPFLSLACW